MYRVTFSVCTNFDIDFVSVTHSVSARRWKGNGFDARPKPRHRQRR